MFSSNATQVSNVNYIEDVFSTYLYTGNGSTQTITNGIDLAGKGGMVWIKNRSDTGGHRLFDTARGVYNWLSSNSTGAQQDASPYGVTAFNSNGFAVSDSGPYAVNDSGQTYASWTFRKQPKFFDVVTYTGTGIVRTVSHNLGSTPGCIIVKAYSGTNAGIENWTVYHRSLGGTKALRLNTTDAEIVADSFWNDTDPTSTVFTVADNGAVNGNGLSYIAYLFAHDAGGFGLTGTDNVISCGSYTGNGSATGVFQNLGFEPQWILTKCSSLGTEQWHINDNMRGVPTGGSDARLEPSRSVAEAYGSMIDFNATGFTPLTIDDKINGSGQTYIYIAIRRGPMKVPTSGTSVFDVDAYTGDGAFNRFIDSGFVDDFFFFKNRAIVNDWFSFDRLRGDGNYLAFNTTGAESGGGTDWVRFTQTQTGIITGQAAYGDINTNGVSNVAYHFRRAPGFFDEVCYTGTGSATTVTHNLGVAPELMIVKSRSAGGENWNVYSATLTATKYLILNLTNAEGTDSLRWNDTAPTASVFSLGTRATVNGNGTTFVAYLFATCAGVSKVGSYTGTGTTLQVNCGFTGGARFVLIKRTDSTGDWYVWDSARGIVAGNDPYLLLNSTAAEVTNTDYVDTYSAGFEISSTAPAAINASGGSFIFLAIA